MSAEERVFIIEGFLNTLDEPDPRLEAMWLEEAQRRLAACREGRMALVPFEEIFKDA